MSNEEENKKNYIVHESENFNSAYFGQIPEHLSQKPDRKNISQIIQLLSPQSPREIREQALAVMKNPEAKPLLLEALKDDAYETHRLTLLTACWETGHDFSDELLFFMETAAEGTYEEAIEAISVIEEMQGPFDKAVLEQALAQLKSVEDSSKRLLLESIYQKLELQLHNA